MEKAAELGVFGALKKMTEVFSGWLPVLILLSLVAGVWLYYLLVSRHEPQHRTLMACVRSFLRFEALLWPVVGRVLYLSITVFLVLSGLLTTILVNFFGGIVGTALLLVIVRILFEMSMMLFGIHGKLMHMEENPSQTVASPVQSPTPAAPLSLPAAEAPVRARKKPKAAFKDEEIAADLSTLPDEEALDAQDGLVPRRKPALSAESLPQNASREIEVDLPLFSGKRVDKKDPPMLE